MVQVTLTSENGILTQAQVTTQIGTNTNVEAIIPNNVITIEASAFAGVTTKVTSITINSSTLTIGQDAFTGCTLNTVTFPTDMISLTNTTQIQATNIYLNPSVLRANAVTGNIWATGNYYLYLSPRVRFGPTGVILPDGSKVPTTVAGTMLRNKTVGETTLAAVLPFKQSFPETYNGYVDIPSVSNNITVHPGFNIICTKSGTGDPNNNSSASIIIPSDATTATGFMSPYIDNTNGSTNLTGTITTTYPSILLFYNNTLVRTMPAPV